MTEFVGTLEKVATREWNGKTMHNLCIKDDGGNETWIGLGLDKPPMQPMSRVKVTASQNAKGFWTAKGKDLQLLKDEPAAAPAASGGGGGGKAGFQDRQASIVLQSSFKTATDQVNALLAAGIFKPAANTKAKKDTAVEAYFAFVEKVAVELYEKAMNPEKFLDQYITDNAGFENPGPSEEDGRPIEDDLPDF